jgi:hypothetical protein
MLRLLRDVTPFEICANILLSSDVTNARKVSNAMLLFVLHRPETSQRGNMLPESRVLRGTNIAFVELNERRIINR